MGERMGSWLECNHCYKGSAWISYSDWRRHTHTHRWPGPQGVSFTTWHSCCYYHHQLCSGKIVCERAKRSRHCYCWMRLLNSDQIVNNISTCTHTHTHTHRLYVTYVLSCCWVIRSRIWACKQFREWQIYVYVIDSLLSHAIAVQCSSSLHLLTL